MVYHIYRKLILNLLHLLFCLIFFTVPTLFFWVLSFLMGLMTSVVKNMWHHDMKGFVCRDYISAVAAYKLM